jgi:inorganic phosphate transporter, PiT family
MIVSPALGFSVAFIFAILLIYSLWKQKPQSINRIFSKLQIGSSIFFSLTHGANDGQKTMGIITALLIAGGFINSKEFVIPIWVIISSAGVIGLGTFLGGWRIIKTMAFRLTNLKPYQGFCAETGGGVILTIMAWFGIPVSTTHAISGAIMGVGSTRRLSAVRWGIGKTIIYAWIITIPISAIIASLIFIIIKNI